MISCLVSPCSSSDCKYCTRLPTVKYVGLHCPLLPYSLPVWNALTFGVGTASARYPSPSSAPCTSFSCFHVRPPKSSVVLPRWLLVNGRSTGRLNWCTSRL